LISGALIQLTSQKHMLSMSAVPPYCKLWIAVRTGSSCDYWQFMTNLWQLIQTMQDKKMY